MRVGVGPSHIHERNRDKDKENGGEEEGGEEGGESRRTRRE